MPSIQAFTKAKAKTQTQAKEKATAKKPKAKMTKTMPAKKTVLAKAKRRPGRDQETQLNLEENLMESQAPNKKIKDDHLAASVDKHSNEGTQHEHHEEIHAHETPKTEKVEISFPGSEVLRAKLPRPFEVAEKVATDWVNDGTFEGLPLGHPLAQVLAAQGLKKAKEVEKKVVASGVIEKVAMQALTYGMKAQQEINSIREQVKSRFGKK
jgi:hypothetical protein